jgi:hypothetical protein
MSEVAEFIADKTQPTSFPIVVTHSSSWTPEKRLNEKYREKEREHRPSSTKPASKP